MSTSQTPVIDRIKFALEDLPNRVTIGFEVETNMEAEEGQLDTDGMREYAEENIDTHDVCRHAGVNHDRGWISALGFAGEPENLAEAISVDWSDLIDNYVENMDTDGWYSGGSDFDEVGNEVTSGKAMAGWEFCEDGSVSGPEFQSPICEGRDTAIEQAKRLFDRIADQVCLSIGKECSCHIHIRMLDVFHKGHNILQQFLFEELFNDLDALPECIKHRCMADNKWIKPSPNGKDTCSSKYNPVQRHSGLGTWEWRIFGNVSDADDFVKCLDAALAATKRAYDRFIGGERRELPADLWCTLAHWALINWKPIQENPAYGKFWAEPAPPVLIEELVTRSTPLTAFHREDDCNCTGCLEDRRRMAIGESASIYGPITRAAEAALAECF